MRWPKLESPAGAAVDDLSPGVERVAAPLCDQVLERMPQAIVQQRLKPGHRRSRSVKAAVVTSLLAAALFALGGPLAPVGTAASFSVTTTADGGLGSLRRAIKAANGNPGLDTIRFAIPGSGVQTIKLTSGHLPVISSPVVIDGRTQPGYSGTPLVRLDNGTGNPIVGLAITAGASQVLGLRITRFFYGVSLDHAGGNTVAADWIGLDTASTSAGNTDAVAIGGGSSGNTIGGTTAAARNVISGNTDAGVLIEGYGTAANTVTGNYIGTNASGTAALANGTGVLIQSGTQNNTVGGSGVGAGNVISGNTLGGVWIVAPDADRNTVAGNYIGTNAAGNHALANGRGVLVDKGASNNVVGGTTAGARNVISGNAFDGIYIGDSGSIGARAKNNLVAGNYIGTNATGTAAVPNNVGVFLGDGGAQNNTVGGTTAAARNVISGNTYYGVAIRDSQTTGNVVAGNYIGTNATGAAALANDTGVIILDGPQNNTVGGTAAGVRNVIAGNTSAGVHVTGAGTSGNTLAGNYIGTTAAGGGPLANGTGVLVDGAATSNSFGGTAAGARNVISGNTSIGVHVTGGGTNGNTFAGNYIGTNAAGGGALANGTGVLVDGAATSNSFGGSVAGARNVLSGNTGSGLHIAGPGTSGNTVAGDFIGTNATGTGALANSAGVLIDAGATKNVVGGTSAGARNLISGNTNAGVVILGVGTSRNVVAGNFIGTNNAGGGTLANGVGVLVEFGASGNTIGARNLISGNTLYGVSIEGRNASANIVQGNAIGTNTAGTGALPNGTGVRVANAGGRNTVGGTSPGTGNTIAFNAGAGVSVDGGVGTSIERNSIEANGGLGIELLNGANNAQAPPEITGVFRGGATTEIEGLLNSTANTGFRIELFASPDCDPSGSGEGQRFLGFVNATTDFLGNADFVLDVPAIAAGEVVAATATNLSSRDSSEFSLCAG